MSFDEKFIERVAAALNKVQLDAVVVGNTGSILHDAPVLTEDVDLFIQDTQANREKLRKFAERMGGSHPRPIEGASDVLRIHADVTIDVIFSIGKGLPFGEVRTRCSNVRVGRHSIRVASLRDIIRSKEIAGRPKDEAALPILRDTLRVEEAAGPVSGRVHRYGAGEKK